MCVCVCVCSDDMFLWRAWQLYNGQHKQTESFQRGPEESQQLREFTALSLNSLVRKYTKKHKRKIHKVGDEKKCRQDRGTPLSSLIGPEREFYQ